jgi:hypothetical protein
MNVVSLQTGGSRLRIMPYFIRPLESDHFQSHIQTLSSESDSCRLIELWSFDVRISASHGSFEHFEFLIEENGNEYSVYSFQNIVVFVFSWRLRLRISFPLIFFSLKIVGDIGYIIQRFVVGAFGVFLYHACWLVKEPPTYQLQYVHVLPDVHL